MTDDKYLLDHKELVEFLLKKHDIHEGIWGVHVEFKFMGANIGPPGDILPASITAVNRVGIQIFPEESNIAFDAAKLNPGRTAKTAKKAAHKRIGGEAVIRK
jgi:hypothetical protein